MKINSDINVPFTDEELKKLDKTPFFIKFNQLFIVLSFFGIFISIVFWILAFIDDNDDFFLTFLILAICLTCFGLICLILCGLPSKLNLKLKDKCLYRILKDGLCINSYSYIKNENLRKDLLTRNKLFNQMVIKYYSNNYSFTLNGRTVNVYNVKQTENPSFSNNSIINSAMNISSNNIGINNIRNIEETPFQGFIIEVENINSTNNFEVREIRDSLSYSLLFKDEDKIMIDAEFNKQFDVYSKEKIEFSEKFKKSLFSLSSKEKGILIQGTNNLYICVYGNYINFKQFQKFDKVSNLGKTYSTRKDYLNLILDLIEEFLWAITIWNFYLKKK